VPEQDIATLFPIMILIIMAVIGFALRSVLWTALILVTIVFTVTVTLGLSGWASTVMSAGTMGSPIIILTLAVAHGVHIMASTEQQMRKGVAKHDSVVESLRINMSPVFITSATTAIGFLSMNFSDAPPFRTLGNLVATGVMVAFVLSVWFLPAVIAILPAPVGRGTSMAQRGMGRFADVVIRHSRSILLATGGLATVLTLGVTQIKLDDDFVKYFDQRFPIRVDSDFTQDHLTGLNVLEYSIPAAREGGVADPTYLHRLDQFADWLREQPKVHHVTAITDVIKRLNMSMHGDDPDYRRIPDDPELAAQYLLLYELSVPFGLDLNNQIDVGKSASRVSVNVRNITSKEMRQLDSHAQAWLHANMPDMQAPGTGLSLMFAHISERNINSMLGGSILALVLISRRAEVPAALMVPFNKGER